MKQAIILRSEQLKNRAAVIIASLPLDPLHEVIIRVYKINRSAQQNAYYWSILTIIAAELGMTKEELAEECKRRFLMPIFVRDDKEFAAMVESISRVATQWLKSDAEQLERQVVRLVSTTQANTSQMAEYLTDIGRMAADLGIRLPIEGV